MEESFQTCGEGSGPTWDKQDYHVKEDEDVLPEGVDNQWGDVGGGKLFLSADDVKGKLGRKTSQSCKG